LKEKLSRKERKQIGRADDLRTIVSVTTLTLKNEAPWKRVFCGGPQDVSGHLYSTTVMINGIEVKFECLPWLGLKQLNISCGKEIKSVSRTGKNKSAFDYLLSLIEKQALEKERQETQKQLDKDTTVLLPASPEKKAAEPTDREKLQRVVDLLKT